MEKQQYKKSHVPQGSNIQHQNGKKHITSRETYPGTDQMPTESKKNRRLIRITNKRKWKKKKKIKKDMERVKNFVISHSSKQLNNTEY
jgi:hypothetical protein